MNITGLGASAWLADFVNKQQSRQNLPEHLVNDGPKNPSVKQAGDSTPAPKVSSYFEGEAYDKFNEYMNQTPGERLLYAWLASHGISKEEFEAMNEEDKRKLLAQMKQEMEDKLKEEAQNGTHLRTDILT